MATEDVYAALLRGVFLEIKLLVLNDWVGISLQQKISPHQERGDTDIFMN